MAPPVFNAIPRPETGFTPRSCEFAAGDDTGGATVMFAPVTFCPAARLIVVGAPLEFVGGGVGAGFELEVVVGDEVGELPFSTRPRPPQPSNSTQANRTGAIRNIRIAVPPEQLEHTVFDRVVTAPANLSSSEFTSVKCQNGRNGS